MYMDKYDYYEYLWEKNWDDYDDFPEYPKSVELDQVVHILLEWEEDVTKERIDEILDSIIDDNSITEQLQTIFSLYYDGPFEIGPDFANENEIGLLLQYCDVYLSYSPRYMGQTADSDEYPIITVEEHDGIPTKDEAYPDKEHDKQALMKVFKEKGWTEIIGIRDIYGDTFEEDDIINSFR